MRLDSRCYWAIYDVLTWHKARNSCLNVGGDLASFDAVNDTDLKDSLKGLRVSKEKGFWVGLSKSVWRWNDKGNGIYIALHVYTKQVFNSLCVGHNVCSSVPSRTLRSRNCNWTTSCAHSKLSSIGLGSVFTGSGSWAASDGE